MTRLPREDATSRCWPRARAEFRVTRLPREECTSSRGRRVTHTPRVFARKASHTHLHIHTQQQPGACIAATTPELLIGGWTKFNNKMREIDMHGECSLFTLYVRSSCRVGDIPVSYLVRLTTSVEGWYEKYEDCQTVHSSH